MNIVSPMKVLSFVDETVGTIYLYGMIGQDERWDEDRKRLAITDTEILQKVKEMEQQGVTRCNVRINSPGGYIGHGDGIIATLRNTSMDVHAYIDGVAASMAADIFLSIKKENRHVNANSKLMIHAPMVGAFGNAQELRRQAEVLDTFADAAIAKMVEDTGMEEEEVRSKYYDGNNHWFSARKAVEIGFVNGVDEYETESNLNSPEKMSYSDLVKFFEQPTKVEAGIWSRIQNFLQSKTAQEIPAKSNQIDDDMKTVEDIQAAVKDGTISREELLKALEVETPATEPEKTIEDAQEDEPNLADTIAKAVEAATAPLAAQIEALKKAPAAQPTGGENPSDEFAGLTAEQIAAKKELMKDNEMFANAGAHGRFERY